MAWFTGKRDSPPMRDDQATISEAEWRKLQTRALKANPQMADMFSEESARGRQRGAEQHRKRGQS